jgi:histone-lysine N-methyltransferase SUV420H
MYVFYSLPHSDWIQLLTLRAQVYFWTTIRKNHHYYKPERLLNERNITDILQKQIILAADAKEATKQLEQLPGIKKYMARLSDGLAKDHFRKHLEKYVHIYMPDCPFEVTTTNRYTITEMEASVTARKVIKRGQIIKYLCGTMVNLTSEDEAELDLTRRSFSIVHSSRKKTMSLFLGPARLANHDCQPNSRLSSMGSNKMEVMAIQTIRVDEEVTVSYGDDYFGVNNCECLCSTCEKLQRNGWASEDGPTITREVSSSVDIIDPWGYSLRSQHHEKRKLPIEFMTSGTPTPEVIIDSKRRKTVSRERDLAEATEVRQSSHLVVYIPRKSTCLRNSVRPEEIEDSKPCISKSSRMSLLRAEDADHVAEESDSTSSVPTNVLLSHTSPKSTPATSVSEEDINAVKVEDDATGLLTVTTQTVIQSTEVVDDDEFIDKKITTITTKVHMLKENESEISELSEVEVDSRTAAEIHQSISNSRSPVSKAHKKHRKSTHFALPLTEGPRKQRIPGDYLTDKSLLAKPASKKLTCHTCKSTFVQENAYEPHADCPRCERHSKLHGFSWPKSEREDEKDTEIRYLDHRQINRTLGPGYKSDKETSDAEPAAVTGTAAVNTKAKKPAKAPLKGGIWKGWVPVEQEWEQRVKQARKANNRVTKKTTVKKVTATSASKPSGVTKTKKKTSVKKKTARVSRR